MIEEIWTELEQVASSSPKQGIVCRRILPDAPYDLFLAFQKRESARLFLMAVSGTCALDGHAVPAAKGFTIDLHTFADFRPDQVMLAISLRNADYKQMFSLFVSDVIEAIAGCATEADRIRALLNRIARWQRFLEKQKPDALSPEAQRGLYGELWSLREFVLKEIPPLHAVKSWTGPDHDKHDFQFRTCAVEIKTTISKQPQRLYIASETQLDDSNTGGLYLVALPLDILINHGETLPEMVNSILSLLESDDYAKLLFEEKLFEAGYMLDAYETYSSPRYAQRGPHVFSVTDGFPRIIEDDLRNGVGDVRYTISLAECIHYEVKTEELSAAIRRHLDG